MYFLYVKKSLVIAVSSQLWCLFFLNQGLQESHGEPASYSSQVTLHLQLAGLRTCYPRLPATEEGISGRQTHHDTFVCP